MTPSLASVYDDLVRYVAEPAFGDEVHRCRSAFQAMGAFSPSDAWFEERMRALWDRVLCEPALVARLRAAAPTRFTRAHFAALDALSSSQRGLFEVHVSWRQAPLAAGARSVDPPVDLACIFSGAAFRLAPADEMTTAFGHSTAHEGSRDGRIDPGLMDARVVPTAEGVALLPGALMHPPDASASVRELVVEAKERGLTLEATLDSLLAMRHRHASLSRMKARQSYRVDLISR